jgi:flagellar motility protein MotE (MotC chaperone)
MPRKNKVVDHMAEDILEQAGEEGGALDKKAQKKAERARKKEEKKQRKAEKKQMQEEGDTAEEEESGGSKIAVILATIVFIAIWLAILALIIKMDIGGFGSTVLQPILKDVPVINKILPETGEEPVVDAQYPYTTLNEAIDRIKELEVELSNTQSQSQGNSDYVAQLEAEVARLREFENEQSAFEEEKTKFYKEVVFNENAPDISEYKAYYESIDPANAEVLYKQVVQQQEADAEIEEYAKTYSEMKPKQAAAIMEAMQDNLKLVVKILENMETDSRSDILAAMNAEVAARITKMMEP